jgi:hypothetical protein
MAKQFNPYAYVNVPKNVSKSGYIRLDFETYDEFKLAVQELVDEYEEVVLYRVKRTTGNYIIPGEQIERWRNVNNQATIIETILN